MSTTETPAPGSPEERRADYVRALNDELESCQRAGKDARVAAIEAELARVTGQPVGRTAAPADVVEASATEPQPEPQPEPEPAEAPRRRGRGAAGA